MCTHKRDREYLMTILKNPATICLVALACLVVACSGSDPQPSQTVIRAVEFPQCEPRPVTMAQLDAQLANAGVEVRSKSCAWDGRGVVTACGAPVVLLRVVEIPQDQVPLTATLGYRSSSEFPVVRPIDCPAQ